MSRAKGELLQPASADGNSVTWLARVAKEAEAAFGDAEFARKWLSYPNPALRYRIPIEIAKTDSGAREVKTILIRIAYGVFS
jgi:putative toxin-antitoxin system antitoxin component (TIGR02293 family)